ncbi:hypothetical protein p1B2 (plasmid) [Aromatoleum aromaticum EbN1]|uniref:Uncharacterized protein n=1 Tax=Aromatoleum aromaticum (strain DSM 19018 / LMG 30748 / EbN1) TaxID=76114 RepID=Q5NXG0_AROAE|nr:hypothetical protein p1B2 [Aromatoleum aromaticum EbN1]
MTLTAPAAPARRRRLTTPDLCGFWQPATLGHFNPRDARGTRRRGHGEGSFHPSTPAMRGEHADDDPIERRVILQPPRCAGNTASNVVRRKRAFFNPRDARGTPGARLVGVSLLASTPAMRGEHGRVQPLDRTSALQPPRCAGNTSRANSKTQKRHFNPRDARGTH